MLCRLRMKPTSEESGKLEALASSVNCGHCFPLIFVDGQMPGMDRFALTAEIRKQPVFAVRRLEKRGHAVTIACDGNEALMAARKEEF